MIGGLAPNPPKKGMVAAELWWLYRGGSPGCITVPMEGTLPPNSVMGSTPPPKDAKLGRTLGAPGPGILNPAAIKLAIESC